MSKAIRTTEYIIEKVTPLFNKKGFVGTSMNDITTSTGLTKGAIYGNFKNKEELALAAFNTALKRVLKGLQSRIQLAKNPVDKLFKITEFYAEYYDYIKDLGGCPVVNFGVDANHHSLLLHQRVKDIILKLQNELSVIIDQGIRVGEIKPSINSYAFSKRMLLLIEGGIFMSTMMRDKSYLVDATKLINTLIENELKK